MAEEQSQAAEQESAQSFAEKQPPELQADNGESEQELSSVLRKSTKFSNASARITKMIMMRNGVWLKSQVQITGNGAPHSACSASHTGA